MKLYFLDLKSNSPSNTGLIAEIVNYILKNYILKWI